MGNPAKLVRKYHRLVDDLEADSLIMGTVKELDIVDPVPPERLTRGMTLETGTSSKYIPFFNINRPPVELGEAVYVIGTRYIHDDNQILPAVIFSSRKKWVAFSKELPFARPKRPVIGLIVYVLACFSAYLIIRPFNYALSQIPYFLTLTSFLVFFCVSHLIGKPLVIHCNSSEWDTFIAEVKDSFDLEMND